MATKYTGRQNASPFFITGMGWITTAYEGKLEIPSKYTIEHTKHYKTLTDARKDSYGLFYESVIYRIVPGPKGYTGHIVGSVGNAQINGKWYEIYREFLGYKRIKQSIMYEPEIIHGRTWILNKDGTLGRRIR